MLFQRKPFCLTLLLLILLSSHSLALELLAGGEVSQDELVPELKARAWLGQKVGLDASVPLGDISGVKVTPLLRANKDGVLVPYMGLELHWKDQQLSSSELAVGLELKLPQIPDYRLVVQLETNLKDTNVSAAILFDLGSLYRSPSEPEPLPPKADEDLLLLAQLISAEARGEPYLGQVAVGGVVLNRVKSPLFPNTIRAVIYQPAQFSPVLDGSINREPTESGLRAAREALMGHDPSRGALFFYNPELCSPAGLKYMQTREVTVRIGRHVFAK